MDNAYIVFDILHIVVGESSFNHHGYVAQN